ncbi:MAG TPA: VOC family protein [Candidatus Acidoferrum sp.]|nr:VOC family protein [Candidatus Acidoferrum sp.]
MIFGAHVLLYSEQPEADRAFFRDVLGWRFVDVGGGWLIFRMPPAEVAVHPGEKENMQMHGGQALLGAVLYLMCDDVRGEAKALKAKGVKCTEVGEEQWGIRTTIKLPSGGEIGLYQPKHEMANAIERKETRAS